VFFQLYCYCLYICINPDNNNNNIITFFSIYYFQFSYFFNFHIFSIFVFFQFSYFFNFQKFKIQIYIDFMNDAIGSAPLEFFINSENPSFTSISEMHRFILLFPANKFFECVILHFTNSSSMSPP